MIMIAWAMGCQCGEKTVLVPFPYPVPDRMPVEEAWPCGDQQRHDHPSFLQHPSAVPQQRMKDAKSMENALIVLMTII